MTRAGYVLWGRNGKEKSPALSGWNVPCTGVSPDFCGPWPEVLVPWPSFSLCLIPVSLTSFHLLSRVGTPGQLYHSDSPSHLIVRKSPWWYSRRLTQHGSVGKSTFHTNLMVWDWSLDPTVEGENWLLGWSPDLHVCGIIKRFLLKQPILWEFSLYFCVPSSTAAKFVPQSSLLFCLFLTSLTVFLFFVFSSTFLCAFY